MSAITLNPVQKPLPSLSSPPLDAEDYSKLLINKDLHNIKRLYAIHKRLDAFLKPADIQQCINAATAQDEELLFWLLNAASEDKLPIDLGPLFEQGPRWGKEANEALAFMKRLQASFATFIPQESFSAAFANAALLTPQEALPIMQWLLDTAAEKIPDFNPAFIRAVNQGDFGVPLMKWLMEKGKAKIRIFNSDANSMVRKNAAAGQLLALEWLLDNIPLRDHSFQCQFDSSAYQGIKGLPVMKLLWAKTPARFAELHTAYVATIFNHLEKWENQIPELMEWLYESIFLLQGSPSFPQLRPHAPLSSPLNEKAAAQLNKWGIDKPAIQNPAITNYRKLFMEMSAQGLPFFERACRQLHQTMSPYNFRWAFLKAAANGEAGVSLMEWLCQNKADKLSYWTLAHALIMAEKQKDPKTADWIKKKLALLFKEGEQSPDKTDIKLHLALSCQPCGYRALGDIPERLHWQPLSQQELDKMPLGATSAEDPFADSVEIVEDNVKPELNQIRKSEADLYRKLYAQITRGNTPFQVKGSDTFKKQLVDLIKTLLSRPSGRWLILLLCRQPHTLLIEEDSSCLFSRDEGSGRLGLNVSRKTSHYSHNGNHFPAAKDSVLFHELLHALHYFQDPSLCDELEATPSSDKAYDNLEEQYTIAGVDKDSLLSLYFALCENTYNFERGYHQRHGHKGFPHAETAQSL